VRVLFVTSRFPYPPLKGDQLIVFHRLRLLARRHEVHVLAFAEDEDDLAGADELRRHATSVESVLLPRWRAVANVAFAAPFSPLPLQLLYFRSREFRVRLARLLERHDFDVVHAYFHRVVPFVEGLRVPTVVDLMDSMQLRAQRNAETERRLRRVMWREELRRIRRLEHEVAARFPRVLVVSEQDRALIPGDNVVVVPNGVDAETFSPQRELREPNVIVFSGVMRYGPNVHAVHWFVDEVLPRLEGALLRIVGANPARSIRELDARPNVEVTGFVESMPEELNRASVAVAPMVSGSGIQNKILESLAVGVPVVATPIGRGSIEAGEDDGLIVAEDAGAFAEAVSALLRDPARAQALGARGRELVLERYTWERNAEAVEAIYEEVVSAARDDGA
jgi:sugar transferase (PEP-CTERM/EpsH1 system associated)